MANVGRNCIFGAGSVVTRTVQSRRRRSRSRRVPPSGFRGIGEPPAGIARSSRRCRDARDGQNRGAGGQDRPDPFHSFEQEVLPEVNRRGMAALGMKSICCRRAPSSRRWSATSGGSRCAYACSEFWL